MKTLHIFALGGNQISPTGQLDPLTGKQRTVDLAEQWQRTAATCQKLARIIAHQPDDLYVLTHGNGPQVGNALLRSEAAADILPVLPLDVCDADTQGSIGYMLAQLSNALRLHGINRLAAETITQVVVDAADPSFQTPTKFIGPAYSQADAAQHEREGQVLKFYKKDTQGQELWRRVVPSPEPIDIVEIEVIEAVLSSGHIPIAVGGGGIPVVQVTPRLEQHEEIYECKYGVIYRRPHQPFQQAIEIYSGVEAVIDKDLASSLLATRLLQRARRRGEQWRAVLTIFTDVDGAKRNFQEVNQEDLRTLSLQEAKAFDQAGLFPAGSMGPKVRAAINFLEGGGDTVRIGLVERYDEMLKAQAGTTISG